MTLPITEYHAMFDRALKIGKFLITGEINFIDEESVNEKYDEEYRLLKEIGYL